MTLIGLLINVLVMVLILAVVFAIVHKILAALGHADWINIASAIILLIGLIWFLSIVGILPGGGPIIQYPLR